MEKQVGNYQHQQHQQHNDNSTNNGLIRSPQSEDLVLRWGNRKRLRCMKIQVKDEPTSVHRTSVRVDRRVVRSDDSNNSNNVSNGNCVVNGGEISNGHGHFNLRQRRAAATPVQPRILRNNSESGSGIGMRGSNGVRGMVGSPERGERKGSGAHQSQLNVNNNVVVKTASSDKGGGGSSSGGSDGVVWPPKFMIGLTNKEKEEDFMSIKGSKLPQRPKKRAKYIQRTLNLVSPGGWLCDLTLERYEVREKKTTKKRPRGLKAMGNYMDSDSD